MSANSGSPTDFREHSRAPLKAPATLQIDAFSQPVSGYTADLSQGGMFVQTKEPPPVGSIVRFEVDLGSPDGVIRGTAEVVWMRTEAQGARHPAGIGLQFRFIEGNGEPLLSAAVHKALEELGPEPEPTPPVKRRPQPPRPPASEAVVSRSKRKSAKLKKAPPQKKKADDDSKKILGMPAEKAKLVLLLVLMAFLLLTFML